MLLHTPFHDPGTLVSWYTAPFTFNSIMLDHESKISVTSGASEFYTNALFVILVPLSQSIEEKWGRRFFKSGETDRNLCLGFKQLRLGATELKSVLQFWRGQGQGSRSRWIFWRIIPSVWVYKWLFSFLILESDLLSKEKALGWSKARTCWTHLYSHTCSWFWKHQNRLKKHRKGMASI